MGAARIRRLLSVAATALATATLTALVLVTTGSGASTATAPTNVSAPVITGTAAVGQTLSATTGSWSGDTPMSFGFQWERCDSSGGNCTDISGAATSTYTVASADVGYTLRVSVTASNSAGSGKAPSAATGVIANPQTTGPPVNTSPPFVTGSVSVGSILTVQVGSWTGAQPIGFSYQWERCDTNGGNCRSIGGAVSTTYRVSTADQGSRLVVLVFASNSAGSKQVVATAGNVPGSSAPVETSAPTVSGRLEVAQVLKVSAGSWSGAAPITVSYQWERCNANGGNCALIKGATGSSYRVTSADLGHRLIVIVTAKNSFGSARAVVTAGNIGGGQPTVVRPPSVSGSLTVGSTLKVSVGTWVGTQPISYSYQWERCDLNGGGCLPIRGVVQPSYKVTAADVGHRLVVLVAARNAVSTRQVAVTAGNVGSTNAISANSVSLPDRLVIDKVKFSPNPVRSRNTTITARFHVSDSSGRSVSGALVLMLGIPYNRIPNIPEGVTDANGWASFEFRPTRKFPIIRGGALVVFVRARTPKGDVLAGASTRRLVQLNVTR